MSTGSAPDTPRRGTHSRPKHAGAAALPASGFGLSLDRSHRSSAAHTPSALSSVRRSHRRTRSIDAAAHKSALKVCLRVRPLLGSEAPTDPPIVYQDNSVVVPTVCSPFVSRLLVVVVAVAGGDVRLDNNNKQASKQQTIHRTGTASVGKTYSFSSVFGPETTQEALYNSVGLPIIKHVVSGNNAFVFAYGVTNSGKTYTVFGDHTSSDQSGLLPRMLDGLLDAVRSVEGARVEMGMAEVYNENVYDLLAAHKSNRAPRACLPLVEDSSGRTSVVVKGLLMHAVATVAEARRLVAKGCRRRQVGQTRANSDSSRSHAVVVVRVLRAAPPACPSPTPAPAGTPAAEDPDTSSAPASTASAAAATAAEEVFSELMLVDMAGSERTSRTNAVGARLQEAANINTSLLTFSRCINALLQHQQAPASAVLPPFRESKLTRLVQDAFIDPYAATTLIVNASPCAADWSETANSLQFGAIAQALVRSDESLLLSGSKRRRTGAASASVDALQKQLRDAQEQCEHERGAWEQRQAELLARIEALERENAQLKSDLEWSRSYFQSVVEKISKDRKEELLLAPPPPRPPRPSEQPKADDVREEERTDKEAKDDGEEKEKEEEEEESLVPHNNDDEAAAAAESSDDGDDGESNDEH